MTDNEQICARCGSEIYNYQGVAYYGMYIAHRDPADCTEYLKRKIQAIEKEAIALRAAVDKPQWIDAAVCVQGRRRAWDVLGDAPVSG